jgi:hypothetical protein
VDSELHYHGKVYADHIHQGRRSGGYTEGATDPNAAEGGPTNVPGQVDPLTETTNEGSTAQNGDSRPAKPRVPRERKQRGPPEDGTPSKTKVMVANLPYDLTEEKVNNLMGLIAVMG